MKIKTRGFMKTSFLQWKGWREFWMCAF